MSSHLSGRVTTRAWGPTLAAKLRPASTGEAPWHCLPETSCPAVILAVHEIVVSGVGAASPCLAWPLSGLEAAVVGPGFILVTYTTDRRGVEPRSSLLAPVGEGMATATPPKDAFSPMVGCGVSQADRRRGQLTGSNAITGCRGGWRQGFAGASTMSNRTRDHARSPSWWPSGAGVPGG